MRQLQAGTHRVVDAAKNLFYSAYLRLVLQKNWCIEVGDLQAGKTNSPVHSGCPAVMAGAVTRFKQVASMWQQSINK